MSIFYTQCFQVLHEAGKIKNYRREGACPLTDSALGKTLKQISDLRREVCVKVGGVRDFPSELWEVSWDGGRDYVEIGGQRYSNLSSSCRNLLERLERLEAHILCNGVSNKRPQ